VTVDLHRDHLAWRSRFGRARTRTAGQLSYRGIRKVTAGGPMLGWSTLTIETDALHTPGTRTEPGTGAEPDRTGPQGVIVFDRIRPAAARIADVVLQAGVRGGAAAASVAAAGARYRRRGGGRPNLW